MSVKNVKAFYEKVAEDKILQKKLKALNKKAKESGAQDAAIDELVEIAKSEGFKFTRQHLADAGNEQPDPSREVDSQDEHVNHVNIGIAIGCIGGGLMFIAPSPHPPHPTPPTNSDPPATDPNIFGQ